MWHPLHRCLDQVGWRFRVCHYHPSCSAYGLDAFAHHRWPVALRLTVFRLLRCYRAKHWRVVMRDPVPSPIDEREKNFRFSWQSSIECTENHDVKP